MEERTRIGELISVISEQNQFQAKALYGLEAKLSGEEREGLDALLNAYERQGDTVEHLADCYLRFVEDIMEEQFYFIRNKSYRYASSSEVNTFFYQNPGYMEYYMKGLAVSTYLMEPHRRCRTWFKEKVSARKYTGGGYILTSVLGMENTSCLPSTILNLRGIWV